MSFFLKMVTAKLYHNAAIYLVLVIEFALGASFLVFAGNADLSIRQLCTFYESQYTNETICLYHQNRVTDGVLAISPSDVSALSRVFPQSELRYRVFSQPLFVVDGEIHSIHIVYCDLPEFSSNFSNAFVGENVRALFQQNDVSDLEGIFHFSQDTLTVGDQKFSLDPLPERLLGSAATFMPISHDQFFSLDDAILLPVWKEGICIPSESWCLVEWDTLGAPYAEGAVSQFIEELILKHGDEPAYAWDYPLRVFLRDVSDGLRLQTMAQRLCLPLFLELIVGSVALMLLFMKRREKELAICLALGAPRHVLAAELLMEVIVVCMLGTLLGIVAGSLLTLSFDPPGFAQFIRLHWQSCLPSLAAGVAVVPLSCLPMLIKIYTAQPDNILRGE